MNRLACALSCVALLAGCSSDAADPPPPPADAVAAETAPLAAADLDPCALITVDEWKAESGYDDIVPDRSSSDVCDFLSDDLFGVVGSVSLQNRQFFDYSEARMTNAERLTGIGDEALSVPLGIIARLGEDVLFLTVNPSVDDQAAVAQRLARLALDRM